MSYEAVYIPRNLTFNLSSYFCSLLSKALFLPFCLAATTIWELTSALLDQPCHLTSSYLRSFLSITRSIACSVSFPSPAIWDLISLKPDQLCRLTSSYPRSSFSLLKTWSLPCSFFSYHPRPKSVNTGLNLSMSLWTISSLSFFFALFPFHFHLFSNLS